MRHTDLLYYDRSNVKYMVPVATDQMTRNFTAWKYSHDMHSPCSGGTEPSVTLGGGVDLAFQLEALWGNTLPTCSCLHKIYQFGGASHIPHYPQDDLCMTLRPNLKTWTWSQLKCSFSQTRSQPPRVQELLCGYLRHLSLILESLQLWCFSDH